MAAGSSTPTISLRERSLPLVGAQEKLSKWLVFSLLLHAGLIAGLFIMPFLPARSAREYPVYTVDLVGGERIGRSNLGTELTPAAAPKESAKKAEKEIPVPESKPEPKKVEKAKSIERTAAIPEKAITKETVRKETAKEKKLEAKETAASLDSVRERLIQAAVERAKNRTDSGQKTSKGEVISSGAGEGEGAAALGKGGRGGGVVKGMDFIIYKNRMEDTIKRNWVWPGQRSNRKLGVTVRWSVKDNGEIIGLKIVQPSGDPAYDDSVVRAVKKSSPLPPVPEGLAKDFAEVEYTFRPEDLGA